MADEDENSFRFRHALLREAAYDALLPGERARLHRAVAHALTEHPELGATGPGYAVMELAEHWWAANDWPEALRASVTAADAAAAVIAMPEAYAYYERALAAGERVPIDSDAWQGIDRIDLDMKTADAAYMCGETERGVDLARRALDALDARQRSAAREPSATRCSGATRGPTATRNSRSTLLQQAAALLPADRSDT